LQLNSCLAFKGGTVLKKAYFPDYRFSEDLNFTLLNSELSNRQILSWFKELIEYARESVNIPLSIADPEEPEEGGLTFFISYIWLLGGLGQNKRAKRRVSKQRV